MYELANLGDEGDPLIWWPGAIEDLVRQVYTQIENLKAAVEKKRSLIDDDTYNSFASFYNEWRAYYDDMGWFAKYTGSTVDRVKLYKHRAEDWYNNLQQFGAVPAGPRPPITDPEGFPWVKILTIAAVVGVGAYALSKVTPVAKLLGSATGVKKNPRRYRRRRRRHARR